MKNVLCLHGLGSSKNAFIPLKEAMGAAYTFYLYDFAGFGDRIDEPVGHDPIEDEIHAVYEQASQMDDLIIIMHSMGSAVGLPLARTLENKVAAVINIEGNLIGADCGYLSRGVDEHAAQGTLGNFKNDIIDKLQDSPFPGWREWTRDFAKVRFETLKSYAKSLVNLSDSGELLDIFHSLECKKLYLYGNEYRDEHHPVLHQIKGIDKRHLNTGHFVMTDDPYGCAELIMELVDEKHR